MLCGSGQGDGNRQHVQQLGYVHRSVTYQIWCYTYTSGGCSILLTIRTTIRVRTQKWYVSNLVLYESSHEFQLDELIFRVDFRVDFSGGFSRGFFWWIFLVDFLCFLVDFLVDFSGGFFRCIFCDGFVI